MQENVNVEQLMEQEERDYLDSLSFPMTAYRGMCNAEYESRNFGISWCDDRKRASKYVFYPKNNNKDADGQIANYEIKRNDVFAAWGVKGEAKELILLL